ncbi:PTS fructose transporter subunit IIC [Clostridium sp. K25]|uniref:Pts system fructose-specific EIIABC component n=1 Tax=Clostridium botulinum D str. 1873 TaxID=592027 RepID=A0A9P2G9A4_CLOBO|nr:MULTISPECIES: fructose-specific PTS transporter subunit EIIC [Clostridium]EES92323.1 pts system fructose-specific EIIABC component [Clostridium botulinum D str. 1873]KEI09279.1 PTS fructose transporter subunit IIC [Clostridium sp. K25]MBO3441659.1 PTS sugar transporter subunit IIA [Clostridium haemolyticum]NFV47725.1 PTS fructose transporter subunit IIC [Clostridium botulinum]QPW55181.1 PTS sugar transporter subunit IIA [Clostridium botulinum]
MHITDLLNKDGIVLEPNINTKKEAIDKLVDLMDSKGNLIDKEKYKEAVWERENLTTTGIGDGVAIPHAKSIAVRKPGISAMVIKNGLDYDSLDGQVAKLFFMIAVPKGDSDVHLDVLARLSTMLMDEEFRETLINASSVDEFLKLIDEKEKDKVKKENKKSEKSGYRVLAVTACPTGIAHTYMAAESLEKKSKEMGISLKVETNGSSGVKNILTKEDIENAECIIVAADRKVNMARFEGKRVIETKVANGIHKAEELINEAISGKAPIYHNVETEEAEVLSEKESIGRQLYKHLMNGVSHMLPFVIGGGILIALAFLLDDYSINPKNFGSNTPIAALLKKIGDTSFGFMLPVLAGYIAMSIGDRPALAIGFVGGMMANQGNAGFLGALLAGFISGYLALGLKKGLKVLPNSLDGLKPVLLYPLIGILLIGVISIFVTNPVVSNINIAITNTLNNMGASSKLILGAILGGMMAIDMGGPINKAAYVFGTASLANGQFEFMSAVMIGGMVPPLVIALCTTFFKNKFTKQERQSGITNYIMGLSFITEGAIPFAASDPLRVIPACVIGSSISGALSMTFGCSLRAPHGGIFVLPVISNPMGYFISLVIGSVVGMILLAILKKKI